jgi:hypothetical protein
LFDDAEEKSVLPRRKTRPGEGEAFQGKVIVESNTLKRVLVQFPCEVDWPSEV